MTRTGKRHGRDKQRDDRNALSPAVTPRWRLYMALTAVAALVALERIGESLCGIEWAARALFWSIRERKRRGLPPF